MATSERSLSFSGRFSEDTVSAKVVMLGMSHVGKTCISKRMQTDTYQSNQKTTIYGNKLKVCFLSCDCVCLLNFMYVCMYVCMYVLMYDYIYVLFVCRV